MASLSFLQSSDPNEWANRFGKSGTLPSWVQRLIETSTVSFASVNFPKEKFTSMPGVDGELMGCSAVRPGFEQFVPLGDSVWELSVDGKGANKVRRDGLKRSAPGLDHKNKTFVFATPRTINPSSQDRIQKEILATAAWKGVVIIHGQLFYEWLCKCPTISLDFACEIHGVDRPGIMTFEEAWEHLSAETNPALTEELAILARNREAEGLIKRLSDDTKPTHIAVHGDSDYESVAFILAALKAGTNLNAINRCLVVETYSIAISARRLPPSIFVVKAADVPASKSLSAKDGHHVVLAVGDQLANDGGTIELERQFVWDFTTALTKGGKAEDEAERMSRECGGSLTVFHRRFPSVNALPPWWRDAPTASILLPLLLIGRWDANNSADVTEVEYLTNQSWSQVHEKLRKLLHGGDAPILTAGNVWTFKSQIDAFEVLSRYLVDEHFSKLSEIVRRCFAPTLPPGTGDAEGEFLKPKEYSEQFKDGVAQALLLIAVRGSKYVDRCPLVLAGRKENEAPFYVARPPEYVEILVKELVVLGDYRFLHQSIQDQLHVLLEAAPDPLLDALELSLEGEAAGIRHLLQENNRFFGLNHSVARLFGALRVIAWDPAHLRRICLILTRIAAIENNIERSTKTQSRRSERAIGSLAHMLIWWLPQTFAPLSERNEAIDEIIAADAEVGWQLLMMLRPGSMQSSSVGLSPRLRDYAPKIREIITNKIAYEGANAVVDKILEQADASFDRWIDLVRYISNFSSAHRTAALNRLRSMSFGLDEVHKTALWEELRAEIARHRTYTDARWALKETELANWDTLLNSLTPSDALSNEKWLFDDWFPEISDAGSVEKRQELIRKRRFEVVRNLIAHGDTQAVIMFADKVAYPGFVAESLETLISEPALFASIIDEAVLKGKRFESFAATVSELARRQMVSEGHSFGDFLKARVAKARSTGVSAESISTLLLAFPYEASTWSIIETLDDEIQKAYWVRVHMPMRLSGKDKDYVVDKMLSAGRASSVIDSVAHLGLEINAADVIRSLDTFINNIKNDTDNFNNSHALPEFLKKASQRPDIDEKQLISRELLLLPLLGSVHGIRLKVYQMLASDPQLFVDVICAIYHRKSDAKKALEITAEAKALATRNFELLLSWAYVLQGAGPPHAHEDPGLFPFPGMTHEGEIDENILIAWIAKSRQLAQSVDRADVADHQIGKILAYAPPDPVDGIWPHVAVRNAIELHYTAELASGVVNEQFSKRGVFSKAMFEGGIQEDDLSEKAKHWANSTRKWRHTSSILQKISKMWKREAERANEDVEVRKLRDL